MRGVKHEDLVGRQYSNLAVLAHAGKIKGDHYWCCACSCGEETTVRGKYLRSGHTKSCGCLRKNGNHVDWHDAGRMKTCIGCRESLPLSTFYVHNYVTNQGKPSICYGSRCKQCSRARAKEYARVNRHKVSARAATRYRRDIEKHRIKWKEQAAYKAAHGARYKAKKREGQATNDPRIAALYVEAKRVERLIARCPVFDLPELGKRIEVDHKVPVSKGGKHIFENLQLLPRGLNRRKSARLPRQVLGDQCPQ